MKSRWQWTFVLAALGAPLLFLGCSGSNNNNNGPAPQDPGSVSGTSAAPSEDLTEIAARVDAVLGLGYNTLGTEDVMRRLSGLVDDPLFVVDTREPEDFEQGHIPGAINIPLQSLPQALLDGTSGIPMDTDVVVASYWGNDGNMGSFLINAYRVADPQTGEFPDDPSTFPTSHALFQGMTSWNFDRDLVPANSRFDDALGTYRTEQAVEAGENPGEDQGAFPAFTAFDAATDTVVKKLLVRAKNYLNSVPSQFDLQVSGADLAAVLDDGDATNDPQVVSVRAGSVYVAGHVPGAINVPYQEVANLAEFTNLIDPTGPVVAYCYTGHTGSLSTIALGILGYDAVDLLYGMNGWSTTAPSSGQLVNFDLNRGWDFPLNTDMPEGVDDLADYDPPSVGCQGCHTSLTAVWTELEEVPEEAESVPISSGEG